NPKPRRPSFRGMASILLMDDDAIVRESLEHALTRAGHAVIAASDGRQGLRCYRENAVDLVVTDILMPEMEGIETIMAIRRENPRARIVAISGGGRTRSMDLLDVAEEFGADRVLRKP